MSTLTTSVQPASVVEETAEVKGASAAVDVRVRRIYYGWVMLGVSVLTLAASSPGQTYGVSIFNEPMRQALNLSHSQLASAYMLGTLLASIPITWIGGLMDRRGLRRTLLLATLAFGCSCCLMSAAQGWMTVFLAFLLLRMLGPGAMAFVSGNILAYWFHRRLGLVEGIRQVGAAAAMATIPSVNIFLVGLFGWRGGYFALGLAVFAIMLPIVVYVFRNRPEEVGQRIDGQSRIAAGTKSAFHPVDTADDWTLAETFRTSAFWSVAIGTAWFGLSQTGIFFSLVPLFADRSLSEADAAALMAAFALSLAVMHLIAGALADYLSPRTLLAAGMLGLGISMGCLYLMQDRVMGSLCGLMLGFSQGVYLGASHPLWARYFGRLHLGRIRGALMTINIAASSIGPFFAGAVRDASGSFDAAILTFAIVPVPLALICLSVTRPKKSSR